MKDYYVMAINPGSTSMKFAIYENETCIIKKQYNYVPEQITRFGLIIEQLDMRRETVEQFIRDIDFDMNQLDAVVGRGGVVPPLQSGAYRVNDLLLDRLSLSEKNDWKDEHGRVYQYFTIHQAQELLHFGHEKVCRLFAELDAADLIVRRRQGQGKANRIYLKEFTQKSDFRNSRSPGIGRK